MRRDEIGLRVAVSVVGAKGDCYEANGRFFMDEALLVGKKSGMRIVHGEVTGQGPLDGVRYGHCWIEDGGSVIDVSNDRTIKMPKKAYYALGQIGDNIHKYSPEQFKKKILKHEHWGPWDLKTSTGL